MNATALVRRFGDSSGDDTADPRHDGHQDEDAGQATVADVEAVLDPRGLGHDGREHESLEEEAG
ncbi:hypothetical protein [Aeromicrobium sp. UC242_57]|uniref:hypothetical protein n=1 Tax=Aeromicrobium sp. UC242_57 TaxID=3374624 RepID=UPI0037BD8DA3